MASTNPVTKLVMQWAKEGDAMTVYTARHTYIGNAVEFSHSTGTMTLRTAGDKGAFVIKLDAVEAIHHIPHRKT